MAFISSFPSSPTAPVTLVQALAHQVNPADIESLLQCQKHMLHLQDMKKDLDSVFRRIRFLKMRLSQQYPTSFSACTRQNVCHVLDEEEEQDERQGSSLPVPAPAHSSSESSSSGRSLPTSPSSSSDVG